MHAKSLQSCPTLCNPMDVVPPKLLCPWDFPGKNTEVGCLFFLQGIPCLWDSLGKKYWNGMPCPPPGHAPDPGIFRNIVKGVIRLGSQKELPQGFRCRLTMRG